MQKCRNAAMQKCRNAEIHIYENLRTFVKDHKKHCENRRKSANIYEHAESQKHGHSDMTNPIHAKKHAFYRNTTIHKSTIRPHPAAAAATAASTAGTSNIKKSRQSDIGLAHMCA